MPLAPRIAHQLRAEGHEALGRLPDEEVFAKAMAEDRIIVTADLDFGAIVARTGSRSVSVIVLRLVNLQTNQVLTLLRRVLVAAATELSRGAVVLVEESRFPVRRLPLGS
jgi:predicted nuclease of predicted toxin-antitoxin system